MELKERQGTWTLTGKPDGGGECEHCGRSLVHRYEVTSDTAAKMIVGRGCLKAVTGWTLTAAQAEREVRMIAIRARRDANWAAFTAAQPELAATILADCEAYAAMFGRHYCAGASHEVKYYIQEGHDPALAYGDYMTRRTGWIWVR